ncbi:MAG: transporter substrate-binding domain-containing protein [Paucibacter sp.]|nr:transporter substrate-binding domain-containing protein [Roseateles sp.]
MKATLVAPLLMPGLGGCASASGEPVLRLYYYERPPFHYTDEHGHVQGEIADNAEATLRRAGLRFEWLPMPANRILQTLRSEKGPACSPGWYGTPQRRADFLMSQAMIRDKPLIALVRSDFPVPAGTTARAFFAKPQLRLLLKQNFSQGSYMDGLIAHMPGEQIQRVALEVPQMVRMLKADRADVIITTEAEAGIFVGSAGLSMRDFKIVRFPDVPAQEFRYLLCSHDVSRQDMARIDKAIESPGPATAL